jgi:site-specific DNA-methyltransferase (adenine-specific)
MYHGKMAGTQAENPSTYYSEIGRIGGLARSNAKAQAARRNGRKGGRPSKDRRSRAMRLLASSKDENWGTPQSFFDELNSEFRFTLDAAASIENAKCAKFFTLEDNALQKQWKGRVFCNPPYGRETTPAFVRKASEERKTCKVIVMLLPARTSTKWFRDFIWDPKHHEPYPGVELRFPPRLRNDTRNHPSKSERRWPFPCMIVVFRPLV